MLRFWIVALTLALASLAATISEARGACEAALHDYYAARVVAERNCNALLDATERNYNAAMSAVLNAAKRDRGKPGLEVRLEAIGAVKRDYVRFRVFKVNLILDRYNLEAARRDYRAAVVARADAERDRDAVGRDFRAAVVALTAAGCKWDARLALCQTRPWAAPE